MPSLFSIKKDYPSEMRLLVRSISEAAKKLHPEFIIIVNNGEQLLTLSGRPFGGACEEYIEAIDGFALESVFFGYGGDNTRTPDDANNQMMSYLDYAQRRGIRPIVIDYCTDKNLVSDSFEKNSKKNYLSFASDRLLNIIPDYPPEPHNANKLEIKSLREAKNFLYIINPGLYDNKKSFLSSIGSTDYDIIFIDLFFNGNALTDGDISPIKFKKNGAKRLLMAYMSVGEAADYRYYWNKKWDDKPPSWIDGINPDWPGCYRVKFWNDEWNKILYSGRNSYLKKIINAGFEGVFLDAVDAFEQFI